MHGRSVGASLKRCVWIAVVTVHDKEPYWELVETDPTRENRALQQYGGGWEQHWGYRSRVAMTVSEDGQ